MSRVKAIFYDLDNTLYPQSVDIEQRIDYCIQAFSLPKGEKIKSFWIKEWLENGPMKNNLINKVIEKFSLNVGKEAILSAYRKFKTKLSLEKEVLEFLIRNKKKNIKQFIITNGYPETQFNKIASLHLEQRFNEIIVATGESAKPASKWFVELLRRYNLDPIECLSIGDWYAVDGAASIAARIPFLYISGGPINEYIPCHIVSKTKMIEIEGCLNEK